MRNIQPVNLGCMDSGPKRSGHRMDAMPLALLILSFLILCKSPVNMLFNWLVFIAKIKKKDGWKQQIFLDYVENYRFCSEKVNDLYPCL